MRAASFDLHFFEMTQQRVEMNPATPPSQERMGHHRRRWLRRFSAVELLIAIVLLIVASPFLGQLQGGASIDAVLMTVVLIVGRPRDWGAGTNPALGCASSSPSSRRQVDSSLSSRLVAAGGVSDPGACLHRFCCRALAAVCAARLVCECGSALRRHRDFSDVGDDLGFCFCDRGCIRSLRLRVRLGHLARPDDGGLHCLLLQLHDLERSRRRRHHSRLARCADAYCR